MFAISPWPQSKIFKALNEEFLNFLQRSISHQRFDRSLFSRGVGEVCWDNGPTQEKFEAVWNCLPVRQQDKQALFDLVNNSQDVSLFFRDTLSIIPNIRCVHLFNAIKALTSHLYTQTKKLSGIERAVNETIQRHYQKYVRANSELCYLCGTSSLSQNRFNIKDDDQWTADYDHLLCKDKYPIYASHPNNFIPTCHICNSKAKGAKDILYRGKTRRTAFYPLPPHTQSFYEKVRVVPEFAELTDFVKSDTLAPLKRTRLSYEALDPSEEDMISAWAALYQVPKRVQARLITNFCEYVDGDCTPDNFEDFCLQVGKKAQREPRDMKKTEWRFWWFRLYQWLDAQSEEVKKDVWAIIDWKINQANQDAAETYGV